MNSSIKKSDDVVEMNNEQDELLLITFKHDEAFFKLTGKYIDVWKKISDVGVINFQELLKVFPEIGQSKLEQFLKVLNQKELISLDEN